MNSPDILNGKRTCRNRVDAMKETLFRTIESNATPNPGDVLFCFLHAPKARKSRKFNKLLPDIIYEEILRNKLFK
jgi:hypothetical protein